MGLKGRPTPCIKGERAIRTLTPRASIAATDQALATLRLEIAVNDTPWFPASPAQRGADHAPTPLEVDIKHVDHHNRKATTTFDSCQLLVGPPLN